MSRAAKLLEVLAVSTESIAVNDMPASSTASTVSIRRRTNVEVQSILSGFATTCGKQLMNRHRQAGSAMTLMRARLVNKLVMGNGVRQTEMAFCSC